MWKKGAAKSLGGTCKRRWFKLQILVVSSGGDKRKRLALTYFKSREHAEAGAKKLLGHIDLTTASAIDIAGGTHARQHHRAPSSLHACP